MGEFHRMDATTAVATASGLQQIRAHIGTTVRVCFQSDTADTGRVEEYGRQFFLAQPGPTGFAEKRLLLDLSDIVWVRPLSSPTTSIQYLEAVADDLATDYEVRWGRDGMSVAFISLQDAVADLDVEGTSSEGFDAFLTLDDPDHDLEDDSAPTPETRGLSVTSDPAETARTIREFLTG